MTKRYDIAVVGEIFNDHVFTGFAQWPKPGEEVFAENYAREVGGGAAITACALARLGRRAAVVGAIGKSDAWGRSRLQALGVALDGLKMSAFDTAVSVSVSTREDRSFFTWAGANHELQEHLSEPSVQEILFASRYVHFALRLDRERACTLLPLLREAGCGISIDPGFHEEWYGIAENRKTLSECDYFFPNEKEGELITGVRNPAKMLEQLRMFGIGGAVLKLGWRGAAAVRNGKPVYASPPAIQAIDTTGAGDAFDAGFLDAILAGQTLEQALRRGCACGALSTRSSGGIAALPDREEMEAMQEQIMIGEIYAG